MNDIFIKFKNKNYYLKFLNNNQSRLKSKFKFNIFIKFFFNINFLISNLFENQI